MSVLMERGMGELNGERRILFPLFHKAQGSQDNLPHTNRPPDSDVKTESQAESVQRRELAHGNVESNNVNAVNVDPRPLFTSHDNSAECSTSIDLNRSRKKRRKISSEHHDTDESNLDKGVGRLEQNEKMALDQLDSPRLKSAFTILLDKPPSNSSQIAKISANQAEEQSHNHGLRGKTVEESCESDNNRIKIDFKELGLDYKNPTSFRGIANTGSPAVPTNSPGETQKAVIDGDKALSTGQKNSYSSTSGLQTPVREEISASGPDTAHGSSESTDCKPKKILRYNRRTGTIGSPPTKQSSAITETAYKRSQRGKQPKSRIVVINYGKRQMFHGQRDSTSSFETTSSKFNSNMQVIGYKIDQILKGEERLYLTKDLASNSDSSLKLSVAKSLVSKPANSVKPVHPLFLGKPGTTYSAQDSSKSCSPQNDCTEVVARWNSRKTQGDSGNKPLVSNSKPPSPIRAKFFTPQSFNSATAAFLRFPGAVEPAWPWKDMVHIRGYANGNAPEQGLLKSYKSLYAGHKRSKQTSSSISPDEDIMATLARELGIVDVMSSIQDVNPDHFPPIPSCLRVPEKFHETGLSIQSRIREQLHSRILNNEDVQSSSEDDLVIRDRRTKIEAHAALINVHELLGTNQSAFDMGQCETQAWAQKYAPRTASEVLQSGREAILLKNWLIGLAVNTVEGAASERSTISTNLAPKKRKRKTPKDNFIVSCDDESDDMIEISETELSPLSEKPLRTEMRSMSNTRKLKNTILISGPHGCGKTATVYAVAKELGFEVFEINSASRRGGKDILDKVGSMTGNHQVQGVKAMSQIDSISEEKTIIDAAFAKDLATGRQGTMQSFFQTKQGTNAESAVKPKLATKLIDTSATVSKKQTSVTNKRETKAPVKDQKQSLILIEEADIIYKQDSQFWSTIEELQKISKRPIVITCNNESAIPLHKSSLEAILRLQVPPGDLAVDYLLLVAACEGHILDRATVETLHEGRNKDLRASLTELNFWCQLAVGDINRGLGWYTSHSQGRKDGMRVISKGTYQNGMGRLSQDILESHISQSKLEEEILAEVYESSDLDIGDWHKSLKLSRWADKVQKLDPGRDRWAALDIFSSFTDDMSDADILSANQFALRNKQSLDATQPAMSTAMFDEYPIEHTVIDALPNVDYSRTSRELTFSIRSRARNYLQNEQHANHGLNIRPELNSPSAAHILKLMCKQVAKPETWLSRFDLAIAFDDISYPDKISVRAPKLDPSQFDRPQHIITEDLAPYVRGIVAYDSRLQKERERLSNLLSEGGRQGKRMRTTRSALSALEGGTRKNTRRERYFSDLNSLLVMDTGGKGWNEAAVEEEKRQKSELKKGNDVDEEGCD